jgi:hypothetical protein
MVLDHNNYWNFSLFFMFLLRNFGADYVATGVLVEVVYQLMVLIV